MVFVQNATAILISGVVSVLSVVREDAPLQLRNPARSRLKSLQMKKSGAFIVDHCASS